MTSWKRARWHLGQDDSPPKLLDSQTRRGLWLFTARRTVQCLTSVGSLFSALPLHILSFV